VLEVCPHGPSYAEPGHSPSHGAAICRFPARRIDIIVRIHVLPSCFSEYQNPIRNPYVLLPRPPQTQAAHFKRPYRK
jgi:hypothetical protein